MKKLHSFITTVLLAVLMVSCSKSDESSSAPKTQSITLKIDGISKSFQVQASKINGIINVVGTSSSAKTTAPESISFNAYEDSNEVSDFKYSFNNVDYVQDNTFSSNLTIHANGKLKGTLSGVLTQSDGATRTITDCNFDFTYDVGTSGANDINNTLHMSFTTPDWNRFINCDLLDFYPWDYIGDTCYITSSSQSTNQTFYFSMPKDSSAMALTSNLKKYTIRNYANSLQGPFEFSQKLPLNSGSSARLISLEGLSANSYNEVASITYIGNEPNYALFKIKCRYKMQAYELNNPTNIKEISGTFHLKVRTTRN